MPEAIGPNNRAVIVEADSPSVTIWPEAAWTFDSNPTYYTAGSYRLTRVDGARAEFKFTGSEVWFYADKNIDHGMYTVQIDDGPPMTQSGYSPGLMMQTLLYTTKVNPGPHTLTITNADSTFLGVDYFAYMPILPQTDSAAASIEPPSLETATPTSVVTPSNPSRNMLSVALALAFVFTALCIVLGLLIYRERRQRRKLAHVREQQQPAMGYASITSRAQSPANSLQVVPIPFPAPAWIGAPSVSSSRTSSSSVASLGPFADHHAAPAYTVRRSLNSFGHAPREVTTTYSTAFSV